MMTLMFLILLYLTAMYCSGFSLGFQAKIIPTPNSPMPMYGEKIHRMY
jgi:hypothetical protein